jgi:hypothetical protein
MSKNDLNNQYLQLASVTAIFMASKFNEVHSKTLINIKIATETLGFGKFSS